MKIISLFFGACLVISAIVIEKAVIVPVSTDTKWLISAIMLCTGIICVSLSEKGD